MKKGPDWAKEKGHGFGKRGPVKGYPFSENKDDFGNFVKSAAVKERKSRAPEAIKFGFLKETRVVFRKTLIGPREKVQFRKTETGHGLHVFGNQDDFGNVIKFAAVKVEIRGYFAIKQRSSRPRAIWLGLKGNPHYLERTLIWARRRGPVFGK